MIIFGIILAVVAFLGINSIWAKNEWRYPIFEISSVLERDTNPKVADFHAGVKRGGTTTSSVLFVVYLVGVGIVYWRMPRLWVLIVAGLMTLLLLKGLIGLFRTAYSPKIRLLNYLYSPYVFAWRRDHWSEYTDEQIADAICSAVGINPRTIQVEEMTIDNFLLALCQKTRPQHERDEYPKVLKNLHEQASAMAWN